VKLLRCKRTVIAGIALVLVCAAPATALLPFSIVKDPWNEVILLKQLAQLKQQLQDARLQLQIAEDNIRKIGPGGWGSTAQDVAALNANLSSVGRAVSSSDPKNLEALTAATQLQQINGEITDLRYDQALSDGSVGQMQATESGNRLQSLAIGQMQKQRQLLLSNTVQTEADEQQATVELSGPSALDGSL